MLDKANDKKYEEYKNFIARAYEHCIRLATVLSLFDKKSMVTEQECQCAVGLMYYFIDQRMNLIIDGVIRENEIVECGEKVKKFLENYVETHPNEEITKKILNDRAPMQYRKMEVKTRKLVLEEMRSRDYIRVIEGKKTVIYLNTERSEAS